jgi:tetratricopeptide (TPR) repeat protein
MEIHDYYQVLELAPDAGPEEIKQAYRRLARKYHPDVSDEAETEQRFKNIKEAYKVLSDPQLRLAYNHDRAVIKPYSYAWLRAKISAQLRVIAQLRAKTDAQNRVNVELNSRKNAQMYTPPLPMTDIQKRTPKRFSWLLIGGGIIFILLIIVATSIIVEKLEGWQTHQKLMVAILQNEADGIKTLETADLQTQEALLHYDGVKKALINFYVQQSEKDVLAQIGTYDKTVQQELFQDDNVQKQLMAYYGNKIDQEVKADNFDSAFQLLDNLKEKLKGVKKLSDKYEEVRKKKNQRLAVLSQQYTSCLEDTQTPLLERTHCMAETRQQIEHVGIEHTLPLDANLPTLYRQAIEQALTEKEYTQVEGLLSDWEKLLPDQSEQRDKMRELLNQHRQVDSMMADLTSNNQVKVLNTLSQLAKMDEALQKEVLSRPQIQQNLLAYHLYEAIKLSKQQGSDKANSIITPELLEKLLVAVKQPTTTTPSSTPPTKPVPAVAPPKVPLPISTTSEGKENTGDRLQQCQTYLQQAKGGTGKAISCYQNILQTDPGNAEARAGLNTIEKRFQQWAESALQKQQLDKAKSYIATLERINPRSKALASLKQSLKAAMNRPKHEKPEPPPKKEVKKVVPHSAGEEEEKSKPAEVKEEPPKAAPKATPKPPPKPHSVAKPPSNACKDCNCSELLRQVSMGVKPLTPEQNTYFQNQCR